MRLRARTLYGADRGRGQWIPALLGLAVGLFVADPVRGDEARLHNMAGLAYMYQGKDREAFREFVDALRLDPAYAAPHFNLARILEKKGQYDQAIKQYEAALAIEPTYPGAREALGRLGFYVGRRREADADPRVILAEGDRSTRLARARALIAQGKVGPAREVLEALLAASPGDTEVHLALVQALERQGDLAAAVAQLQRLSVLLPSSVVVALSLARDLYAMGLFDQAQAQAERILGTEPRNREVFLLLGRINLTRGRKGAALRYLLEASRLQPKDAALREEVEGLAREVGMTHYVNGIYFFSTQEWAKAARELRLALAEGRLGPEESSIAQSYVIVAEFSLAKVRESIARIQKEQARREFGFNDKRVSIDEVLAQPLLWTEGRQVEWRGWIVGVERRPDGSDLLVTTDREEVFARTTGDPQAARREFLDVLPAFGGPNNLSASQLIRDFRITFRTTTDLSKWFTVSTPRPLPDDARVRPNSQVRVLGTLDRARFIKNPYNNILSRRPQPSVRATRLDIVRQDLPREAQLTAEGLIGRGATSRRPAFDTSRFPLETEVDTPPGVFGTLRIDYLKLDEVQQKNR